MKQFAGFYFDFSGGRIGDNIITFEINMSSLALGRHVRLFVVDDVPSKLKGFLFNK